MNYRLLILVPLLGVIACGKQAASVGSPQPVVAAEPSDGDKIESAPKKEAPASALAAGGSFKFTDDEAGKIFSKILVPTSPPPLSPLASKGQSERILPAGIAEPRPASLPSSLVPVRIPLPPRVDARPSPLPERVPVDFTGLQPDRPEHIKLPVGGLTRLPTPDVKQPVTVPILGRPVPDRASLDDPTAEFTASSVFNKNLPLRTTTAPFVKTNLPDPFENSEAAKVKIAPKEDPATSLGNPPPPKS
jgi:hypothetical protein